MKLRSLRSRLLAGVVFWTLGVLMVFILFGAMVVSFHPQTARFMHYSLLCVTAAALVTAGVSVIRGGLSPFSMLRERLADVRDGRTLRLEGEYPTEVAPLVDDLNTLLDERERRVARAVARAGDLAHGLKTPLAVLIQEIDRADAAGQHDLAARMRQQVERMRRQIESHLAQARATASGTSMAARANVAEAAEGLVRTMQRLYAERGLTMTANVAPDLIVRVATEDLEEMLGNLLDNACKWAKSQLTVAAASAEHCVVIDVDDDGAGLDAAMMHSVLKRGVRADETAPGSGLGLAIVRDLVEAYGGSVALARSPMGGIRARVTLPAA